LSRKIGKGKTAYVDGEICTKSISMAQLLRQKLVGFQEIFSTFRVAQKDPLDLEVLQAGGLTSRTMCMPICGERLDTDREREKRIQKESKNMRVWCSNVTRKSSPWSLPTHNPSAAKSNRALPKCQNAGLQLLHSGLSREGTTPLEATILGTNLVLLTMSILSIGSWISWRDQRDIACFG
jgi:hypothetical protein